MSKSPLELLAHLEKLTASITKEDDGAQTINWSDGSVMVFKDFAPLGCQYGSVDFSDPFMQAADQARYSSGCFKQQTGVVIVNNGRIITSGSNEGQLQTWCEREKLGCKTGEGYEHCKNICKQFHHAERSAIHRALSSGMDVKGAKLYLSGHWWACAPCWKWCADAGIVEIILDSRAKEKYTKPPSLFAK